MNMTPREKTEILNRIISTPDVLRGRPRIKGTRITVSLLLEAVAMQMSVDEIRVQWPDLTKQDIQAALLFGARSTNYEWVQFE